MSWLGKFSPPPDRTVSQWADECGYLVTGTGRSRRWQTREPQRAILDAFDHPDIHEINVIKSSRFGWTSILMQAMGFFIDQDPSKILMVQPRGKDMEEWSKEQVQPTIDVNPNLSALVVKQRHGTSGNVIDHKEFPGGPLRLRASNSPDGFRRYDVRVAMNDEVDAYPRSAGKEGDVIGLIYSRAQDAWNYVIANGSTPTEEDISLITRMVGAASAGYPFLPCPHCGEYHIRRFKFPDDDLEPIILRDAEQPVSVLTWEDGKPSTACYVCRACGGEITQRHHNDMLDRCIWIGEHWEYRDRKFTILPGFDGRIGFAGIWAGYVISPNTTPQRIVSRYERDKAAPETFKTFHNTVLGLAWKEPGEQLRSDTLYNRREQFAAEVPAGAVYLTMGIDVQGNRWEFEVVGWGPGEESWSVDYQIVAGDPSQDDEWWQLLRPYLLDSYKHESGVDLPISAIGIDHGFLGKRVESFVRRLNMRNVFAFKGVGSEGVPFVENAQARLRRLRKQKSSRYRPELIGDYEAKQTVLKRLRVDVPGPGYCHIPEERGRDWCDQITAEKLVTKYRHGRPYREWIMLQPRNEALDCRKMAYAAMLLVSPDLTVTIQPKTQEAKKEQVVIPQRRVNFVNSWKR